ncbi:NAD(P)-dependent oxidoreductase [Nocardia coffeae]|uniref:NAD(P)-dependent oxidoreductase n=1 Tax=Nocardia coffeae TaxID=2873381 RepID=UPI0027DFAE7E|nr:NAD(P)-dependent oxidoreductase [Nocardia coffeae]
MLISSRTVLSNDLLDWAPRLRGIVFGSIGTNSCDVDHATSRGILVANGATSENVESVAEATVVLMAALLGELLPKIGEFRHPPGRQVAALSSRMLRGRTIGFLGFGRIARQAHRRLQGWSVGRTLAWTRTPAEGFPDVEFTDLATVLAHSDVVSVHLPLSARTRGLLDHRALASMKSGAVLVNTARGGIVDEQALAEVLRSGHLAGAALDTFAQEPPPPDHPLAQCHNTILTNHNAGHTGDLFASLVPAAVENTTALLDGRLPAYLANREAVDQWRSRISNPHRRSRTGTRGAIEE